VTVERITLFPPKPKVQVLISPDPAGTEAAQIVVSLNIHFSDALLYQALNSFKRFAKTTWYGTHWGI